MNGTPRQPLRRGRNWCLPWIVAALGACATAPPQAPGPSELPALEARLRADSTDVATLVALGAGYQAANDPERARPLLEKAVALAPDDQAAILFLGATYEDLELLDQALATYTSYLEGNPSDDDRDRVQDRVALLRRRLVERRVRAIVQGEATRTVAPSTVAVFPFVYAGTSEDYAPLGRALAAMLATDLSLTDRLTVVERLELQLLLDETALGQSALVDPATAVQPGRLVGAGEVVQGALGGDDQTVTLEAAVVGVSDQTGEVRFNVSNQGAASDLFDLEKDMAFSLYDALGVELTPAERERISERWTDNVQALLQFGMGLEAEDRGDYAEARARYQQAVRLDPGFDQAQSRAGSADEIFRAASVGVAEIADIARAQLSVNLSDFQDLVTLEGLLNGTLDLVNLPGVRDVATELLGVEGFRPATLHIVLGPPKGGSDR